MRLVDSLEEQAVLESILEQSKPALAAEGTQALHYLLATPFRYRPHSGLALPRPRSRAASGTGPSRCAPRSPRRATGGCGSCWISPEPRS